MTSSELPEMNMPERFRASVLQGTKLAMTRPVRFAPVGSRFVAFGQEFVLVAVRELTLDVVATYLYRVEGFRSKEDFMECWCSQFPDSGCEAGQTVYVHMFTKAGQVD